MGLTRRYMRKSIERFRPQGRTAQAPRFASRRMLITVLSE
jgi:hypothetical protein